MIRITHSASRLLWPLTLWLLLSALAGALLVSASAYIYLSPKLPSVDSLKDIKLQTPLRVYTSDGLLIGEFGEKRRTPIEFEQIPPLFISAILAAEDDGFYSHHGVDVQGLLRAASQLLLSGSIQTGGSTITMQVAKNYFLSQERTFSRKFNEILLSLQIERELEKGEILELYLNKIFLGNRAYGIEAAAQVYYGKPINQLDLAQLAMIAGLPKAPSAYNPIVNPSRAIVRRNWILGRMFDLEYIDEASFRTAINSPITASFHGSRLDLKAPYIAEMARKEMLAIYGRETYTAGYKVFTTIDSKLQIAAEQAVQKGLLAYDQRHGYRGPEQQLPPAEWVDTAITQTPPLAVDNGSEPEPAMPIISDQLHIDKWLSVLKNNKPLGGLLPAIVIRLHEQAFDALLANGEEVVVEWESGIAGIRPFQTIDRLGPRPKKSEDLVTVGDLIRLQKNADGTWKLAQIPQAQAALVSLDADNGAILSLVGGFDYQQSKFNRITQASRQPGSNFKPFIYTAALANGYTSASIFNDAPIVFEDASLESSWRPTNDSGKFYGPTRLRYALYKSRNLVSIRLLRSLGIGNAINYIGKFGFNTRGLPKDLSLALGSHSLKPIQIVSGYSIFANGGHKVDTHLMSRIEDINGETLYQAMPATVCLDCETEAQAIAEAADPEELTMEEILGEVDPDEQLELPRAERVIEARDAYIIDSILRDVVQKGTAKKAKSLNRSDAAGKTGTTNGPTDAWFSGYSSGVVTTAWLGFDKNQVLGRKEYGGSAALPIWIDYMGIALEGRKQRQFKQPEGIVSVKIDPTTGLLAKPGQSNAIFELFREEHVPKEEVSKDAMADLPGNVDEITPEDIF